MNKKILCKIQAILAAGAVVFTLLGGNMVVSAESSNVSGIKTDSTMPGQILTQGKYEESEVGINYVGTWIKHNNVHCTGQLGKYSYTPGDYVTFTFAGTGFSIKSFTSPNRGIGILTIDGGEGIKINSANYPYSFKTDLYKTTDLEYGIHTVKYEVTDEKNEDSNALTQFIDAIEIYDNNEPVLQSGSYEESDRGIHYDGIWVRQFSNLFSGGMGKYSVSPGNSVSFKFEGTGFDIKSFKSPNRGIAKFTVDGQEELVDLSSDGYEYNKSIYSKTGLEEGVHTVKFELTRDKNSNSNALTQFIDSVDIF